MVGNCGVVKCFLALCAVLAMALVAPADVLDSERLRALFPPPYIVGEKDALLPVWPVFKQNGPATELTCYVFESIRLRADSEVLRRQRAFAPGQHPCVRRRRGEGDCVDPDPESVGAVGLAEGCSQQARILEGA
jgi:hypothetical protein